MKVFDHKEFPSPKEKMLRILSRGDLISEEFLAGALGMPESLVRSQVAELQEEGFRVESIKNQGYLLKGLSDFLFPHCIERELKTSFFGQTIQHFFRTDSTNTRARAWASDGAPDGALVVAEYQEKGKGRLNRVWQSPSSKNLLFSLILRPDWPPPMAFYGTVLASVSLCRAVQEIAGITVGIKWPNDLYSGGKKLAGILTEFSSDQNILDYMIIGIGLNCHWAPEVPPPGGQPATSILKEAGREISRLLLLTGFLTHGENLYKKCGQEGVGFLREEWNRFSLMNNRKVTLVGSQASWKGLAQGIDDQGGLMLLLEDGRMKTFLTGDVHLRFQEGDDK